MLEIEQKFPVHDPITIAARLQKQGVVFGAPVRQIDTYFAHPARDFRQTDEAFRLRQIGEVNLFTYKGPKLDATTKTRREIEVPLAPGAVATDYQTLLAALGFQTGGLVCKTRRTGHASALGRAIDVAWDEVDGLGTFLELEIVAPESELAPAKAALQALAAQLELHESERRSYLTLLEAARS